MDAAELSDDTPDRTFVAACYRRLLGRDVDPGGLDAALHALSSGSSRLELVAALAESSEFFNRSMRARLGGTELPDLREVRPGNYEQVRKIAAEETTIVFRADEPADYDWMERMILEHGYYERPGIWTLSIDIDKQVLAEMIAHLSPARVLELGCANGAVLKLLKERGVGAEGVEISHLAHALAFPEVRRDIHYGDLLSLPLNPVYDVIAGMDIFEHLNPNKLPLYIARCFKLLRDGGFLFTNIPAFGVDTGFGHVFPLYIEPWLQHRSAGGQFSHLEVDDRGWPLNGHLIWAESQWWQGSFEAAQFKRETQLEQELRALYSRFYAGYAPARQSFYVFSKNADAAAVAEVARGIRARGSAVV